MIDLKAPPFTLLAERDMDLVVLEEMLSSLPFRNWLIGKLYAGTHQISRFIGAWHTPSLDPLGTVDLLFIFEDPAVGRCAVLIENKIDQPKQNLQAERYFEFGEKGIQDGLWREYLTCLFSPQAYFSNLEPSEYFSSYLSYEEIENWFARSAVESHGATPERAAYKKMLVRRAIEQGIGVALQRQAQPRPPVVNAAIPPVVSQIVPETKSSLPVAEPYPAVVRDVPVPADVSPAVHKKKSSISDFRVFPGGVFNLPSGYKEAEDTVAAQFWNACLAYASKCCPELGMKKPTGSAEEAGWVEFSPAQFPRDVVIIHKMPQGFMDLSFAMTPLVAIEAPYRPYMDSDMSFKENGKTAIIRISVPVVDPQAGFDKQKDVLSFAVQKAQKLYHLCMHVISGGTAGSTENKGYAPEELYL